MPATRCSILAAVGEHLVLRVAEATYHRNQQAVGGHRFLVLDGREPVGGLATRAQTPPRAALRCTGRARGRFPRPPHQRRASTATAHLDVASHSQRAEVVLAAERWQINRAHNTGSLVRPSPAPGRKRTMTFAGGFSGRLRTSDDHNHRRRGATRRRVRRAGPHRVQRLPRRGACRDGHRAAGTPMFRRQVRCSRPTNPARSRLSSNQVVRRPVPGRPLSPSDSPNYRRPSDPRPVDEGHSDLKSSAQLAGTSHSPALSAQAKNPCR